MKIAFVYDLVHPYTIGGGERRIFEFSRRLARAHEVHCISLAFWGRPLRFVSNEGVIHHGVPVPPGPLYDENGRRRPLEPLWFGAGLAAMSVLRDCDVVDCTSFPFFSVLTARAQTSLGRGRFYATWLEFWGDYWEEYQPGVAMVGRILETLALRASSRVIAISEHTRQSILTSAARPKRVDVLPCGVDLTAFRNGPPASDAPDIIFVGRLIPEKGASLLLDALAQPSLRGASLLVVGQGNERRGLQQQVERLGLGDRVRFEARLEDSALRAAIKGARVLALPSRREGFGIVVLEAMASGTPVVICRGLNSAASELVTNGVTGFVVEHERDELADAISSIVRDPARRKRLGDAGQEAAEPYDWDRLTERLETIYRNS